MDPPRPACLPAPQSALASVESVETLEMLEKVQYNAAVAPAEDKYRRLRLGNARIRTTLADAPGGLAALLLRCTVAARVLFFSSCSAAWIVRTCR